MSSSVSSNYSQLPCEAVFLCPLSWKDSGGSESFVTCPAHTVVRWLNQYSKLCVSTPKPVLSLTPHLAETQGSIWVSSPVPSFAQGPAPWKRSLNPCAYLFCSYLNNFCLDSEARLNLLPEMSVPVKATSCLPGLSLSQ